MTYKVASLFAGVGGICLGFKNAGAEIIWANECDSYPCDTYRANFAHQLVESKIEDVKTEDIPDFDILTSGFPCTSFSVAGYQKGFEDKRTGHLFFETLRVINAKKPQVVLLENVKNLVSHDGGNTFKVITEALEESGYHFKHKVLNSMNYGNVPQNRERIFIVGFLDQDACNRFEFPEEIQLETLITDVTKPSTQKEERYYYRKTKVKGKNEDGSPKIIDCQYYPMLKEAMTNKDTVYQLRRIYVRENKSNVCPTLTANMGTGGHNVPLILDDYGIRKLTPRECFTLQGFPDSYVLPKGMSNGRLYKQAGNSVTVTVIQRIAENILNVLNNT